MYLDFEVQQVAVDLVVNIGVVLLLAQVQPWDVHSGLQAQQRQSYHTHKIIFCVHIFFIFSLITESSDSSFMILLLCFIFFIQVKSKRHKG